MNWILLLPVAGLLFLGLAAADWALLRVEQNELHQSRWKSFGASGLGLLLVWGGIALWPTQPTWASDPGALEALEPVGAPAPLYAWQTDLQPALAIADSLLTKDALPTLPAVRTDRATLLEARRQLANRPLGTEAEEALMQQADALLGVAYQALGEQWSLVRQGEWNEQGRTDSLALLKREWATYQSLGTCLAKGRRDCLPAALLSERNGTIHAWQRMVRLYLLDCLRFDETDPDLAWLPAEELRAARSRLQLGRDYVAAHPLPDWATQVTVATDHLFQEADQALRLQETLVAQGAWTRGSMERAYKPVQAAWDLLFQASLCAMQTEGACLTNQR